METSIFVAQPASLDDIPRIAQLQYQACASDAGFSTIYPVPPTNTALAHLAQQCESMLHDAAASVMVVKDITCGEIASYAIWNFVPSREAEAVEEEMMTEVKETIFPPGAKVSLGQKLIKASVRKRNEVAIKQFGIGQPYMYLAAIGTSPDYQRKGAASQLMQLGMEQASNRILPIYIESTPAGLALYKKFGFHEQDQFHLDLRPYKEGKFVNFCMVRLPIAT